LGNLYTNTTFSTLYILKMTHVPVDLDKIDWEPFLAAQDGGSRLIEGSRYFQGTNYQRGFGLLGSVGRFLMPIVKNLATSAGQEAVNVGKNILEDVSQGRSVSEAMKQHGSEGLQKVGKKLQQCGKGKRKRKQNIVIKNLRENRRRRYRDQLSLED